VLDRIKSCGEINGGQNSSVWRPFLLEAVTDKLDREKNLVNFGPTGRKQPWAGEIRFLDSC